MKRSGTRLEVLGSRLAGRVGVGKRGGEMGERETATYISVCRVIIKGPGSLFLHFYNFFSFD